MESYFYKGHARKTCLIEYPRLENKPQKHANSRDFYKSESHDFARIVTRVFYFRGGKLNRFLRLISCF